MSLKAGQVKKPLFLAITLGVIAGAVGGSVFFVHPTEGLYNLAISGILLGNVVFPAIVSFMASRRYFWWGLVPGPVMWLTVCLVELIPTNGGPTLPISELVSPTGGNLQWSLADMLIGFFVSSGPVSLIRYMIQRRRGLAIAPEEAAPVEVTGKEGAWPPPPTVK